MKGIVFTEFADMVEQQYSPAMWDDLLAQCCPASGGSYTAVGTYDHREMLDLVTTLASREGSSVRSLLLAFGEHLFQRFLALYPAWFADIDHPFALLEKVDDTIHVEVRKLYPDAELPRFVCLRPGPHTLEMIYRSNRPLADLAEGLIRASFAHYQRPLQVTREELPGPTNTAVRFILHEGSDG